MSSIEDAFGGEFYAKFVEARRANRIQRLKITEDVKSDIITQSKEKLSPEHPSFNYMHDNVLYHIILAESPRNQLNIRELQFGKSVSFRWKGLWVSAVMSDEDLEKIEPDQAYLLVGYMKEREGNDGRKFYNFTCHGVITMDEIIEHDNTAKQDQEATKEASE